MKKRIIRLAVSFLLVSLSVGTLETVLASAREQDAQYTQNTTQISERKTEPVTMEINAGNEEILNLWPEILSYEAKYTKETVEIPPEKEEQLVNAQTEDTKEVMYDSASDYFGTEEQEQPVQETVIVPAPTPQQPVTESTSQPTETQKPQEQTPVITVPAESAPEGPQSQSTPTSSQTDQTVIVPQPDASQSASDTPSQDAGSSGSESAIDSASSGESQQPVETQPDSSQSQTPPQDQSKPQEMTPAPETPPAVITGPVLQSTNAAYAGYSQITRYNAWSTELKNYAYAAAKQYGISYELVLAIINNESGFNQNATHVNSNGTTDWGLMQINDVCVSFVQARMPGISSASDLLDPYKNIQAGCIILAYHLKRAGNESDALLCYQVGEGNAKYYLANGTRPLVHSRVIGYRDTYTAAGI